MCGALKLKREPMEAFKVLLTAVICLGALIAVGQRPLTLPDRHDISAVRFVWVQPARQHGLRCRLRGLGVNAVRFEAGHPQAIPERI